MKIFSAKQCYEADEYTIKNQQIDSVDLMERAGETIFGWLHDRLQGAEVKIHVFCGIGNNGGDGLVVSRHLLAANYQVETYIVNYSDRRSDNFLKNFNRIKNLKHWPESISCKEDFPKIQPQDIVIDAIFGIGLNRNPEGCAASLISYINNCQAFVLSIDIPSGLFSDRIPEKKDLVVQANYVLSIQFPKLVFFLPQTGIYLNEWEVLNIGIAPDYINKTVAEAYLIEKKDILQSYIPRSKFSHKGNYGHCLLIGGSFGKIGAMLLASKASIKNGAGLVTAFIPACGYEILQTALPEAMVITTEERTYIDRIDFDLEPSVICMGMGMGTAKETRKAFKSFLKKNKKPLVIDADGINMLAKDKELLAALPGETVLTPHPKELARLIGPWKDDFDKLEKTKTFSQKYGAIVTIKGAHTLTVFKDQLYINNTGNPGMATAGSGDVLAGMISSFIGQGYSPLTATLFGNYMHGRSGDIKVTETGYQALTAMDIIDGIGKSYLDLFKTQDPPRPQQGE